MVNRVAGPQVVDQVAGTDVVDQMAGTNVVDQVAQFRWWWIRWREFR